MSIKTELKAKLQKNKENHQKKERDIQSEARRFIEEFIIPKFREISDKEQTSDYLYITFTNNIGCWYYTSSIDKWENRKDSEYDYEVVSMAVELAEEFDIEANKCGDGAGGKDLIFALNLEWDL